MVVTRSKSQIKNVMDINNLININDNCENCAVYKGFIENIEFE